MSWVNLTNAKLSKNIIKQEYLAPNSWCFLLQDKQKIQDVRGVSPSSYVTKIFHFDKYFLNQSIMIISFHF